MNVVFHGTLIHHLKDLFLAKVKTAWDVERFFEEDPREDFARALAKADVLVSIVWNPTYPPAPNLKLIQLPGTGYESIDLAAVPEGVAVCNAYGHAEGMAEYTMLGMLAWCHRFYAADR